MRHAHRAGKKHQQQGACAIAAHGRFHGPVQGGVLHQPLLQSGKSIENPVHGGHHQDPQGQQLDQRFKGDGGHQAGIAVLGGLVPGAEQDGE